MKRPTIVTLCGSTRFKDVFLKAQCDETVAGKIVLTVGFFLHSDPDAVGRLSEEESEALKPKLDALHFQKIRMSDEILVLNVNQYIGESTGREIAYAYWLGKDIRWYEHSLCENCVASFQWDHWKDQSSYLELIRKVNS